jgi:DMSO/TMAO reductase YedYZ molybdopterin-dependent catalytic subunit
MITRRHLLGTAGAGAALAMSGLSLPKLSQAEAAGAGLSPGLPTGLDSVAVMESLPGKKPLIKLSYRPPNYESPLEYFRTPITPNDQFFVRYHLSDIPNVDASTYKIKVGGDGVNGPVELTFDDLKKLPAFEVVAVNQCSGSRRGLSNPHVAGVEWGYGAMGCARWKGARLKDVLEKAGLKKEAIEVSFDGADGPAVDKTPDFIKSIPAWKAVEESTIIAYEMNGQPLPHLNGFPARIIVPGWTGTYWMKHVVSINALTKPQGGFWMNPAYRIPVGKFPLVARFISQENAASTPITEMVVNSLITSHRDGAQVKPGKVAVSGMAWDGGYGISSVQVSTDGGKTWGAATLGQDLGRYAFRPWSFDLSAKRGKNTVMVNATNKIG